MSLECVGTIVRGLGRVRIGLRMREMATGIRGDPAGVVFREACSRGDGAEGPCGGPGPVARA